MQVCIHVYYTSVWEHWSVDKTAGSSSRHNETAEKHFKVAITKGSAELEHKMILTCSLFACILYSL